MAHIGQGSFFGGSRDVTIHGGTFLDVHANYQLQSTVYEHGEFSQFTAIHLSV